MKTLFSLIISGALVVSGFGQTRNVLVGTNNTVVQPTNFWSADASNARVGLGLGSASTNPASAFQPSSVILSNLAAGGGSSLTNIVASNIVGTLSIGQGGTGSTNASDARTALGLGTAATNPASAFQASSSALTNLASNNAANLTNVQAASIVGAISSSNIPSFNFTNIVGTLSVAQGGTSATNAANARQNLGSTTVGDAVFVATNAASARSTIGATTVGSSVFTLANPSAITFLRLNADNTATALTAADFRTALSLGTAATNPSSAFQPASTVLSNLASSNGSSLTNISVTNVVGALATNGNGFGLTNLNASNITGLIPASNISSVNFSNLSGTLAVSSGGTGATNAGGARTNYGLVWTGLTNTNASSFRSALELSASWLTNTNVTNFRTAIGLGVSNGVAFNDLTLDELSIGANGIFFQNEDGKVNTRANLGLGGTNNVVFNSLHAEQDANSGVYSLTIGQTNTGFRGISANTNDFGFYRSGSLIWYSTGTNLTIASGIDFASGGAATTRSNLGLGWSALTNSNAGTSLVSVSTNGEVVSPTNFWQVAPIQTLVQDLTVVVTTQTNNATNARNLYVYSLATNVSGISNTIILPTNAATFAGDEVTVIHRGTTNTTTVIRQAGSTNNLITINRFDESIKFIRELGQWDFYHNISFVEPIQFSGTNASANAAASRTNLGLGTTNNVEFGGVFVGGSLALTNNEITGQGISIDFSSGTFSGDGLSNVRSSIGLGATNIVTFAGVTNNGDITINQTTATNGLLYIRRTNNEAFLGMANLIASNNVTVSNETLFRVGVAEATNKAAQFGFRSTNTNGNGVAVFSVFGYNALMMIGPSDPNAGTNPIEATVYSVSPTNKVMTLIKTNTGATLFHRAIEFENTTNQAVTRTNLGLGQTNNVTFSALTLSSDLTLGSGDNIVLSTTTGTKIGTATNQLLGFYNQTPITQPSSTGLTNGFTGGGGGATVHPQSTFTGGIGTNAYTVSDIVAHLKSLGLIAQ